MDNITFVKDQRPHAEEESRDQVSAIATSLHGTSETHEPKLPRNFSCAGSSLAPDPAANGGFEEERETTGTELKGVITGANNGDTFEVTFDSDEDPLCPRSIHFVRKWAIVLVICTGSTCVTCTSSIYTTTYSQMVSELGKSTLILTIGLSSFVLGIGLGPLLTGPLSEFFGRRPIYLVSWTLFIVWNIPSAVAKNIETMIIARFFQGFAGGTFLAVAGGTVVDIFSHDRIQMPMAFVTLAPFIGPPLGPLLGGFINYFASWRWTHYVVIIWSTLLLIALVSFAPETYPPIKLRDKARKLRMETADDRYRAPIEMVSSSGRRSLLLSLLRPLQILLSEPMCFILNLYSAILLGILYLFFEAFPLVFGTNHGMNQWQTGLAFLGIIIGMLVATASSPIWVNIRQRLRSKQGNSPGRSAPEHRLPPTILGSVIVPISLFWFGWTTDSGVHWMIPIMGSALFGCGIILVFNGVFTFLVDAYPRYAASTLAGNSLVRCTFAATFPLFGVKMYEALGYQWATNLLAFLTVTLMPFPWVFFKYGKALRKCSRFAVEG
ncbi:major facilitator superfamily domain-containing protein [Aspergillus navahoensis]